MFNPPLSFFKRTAAVIWVAAAAALASCAQNGKARPDTAALTAEVAELKAKLGYLSDRQQIHDVYLRYMRGFDRNDVELLRSAFWPDVQINYGIQSNSFDEFVIRHLNKHTENLASWGHLITNETVDIDGDAAHVETYVTLFRRKKDPSPGDGTAIVSGRYLDRLDRRNGEWRIAVREFIPHYWTQENAGIVDFYSKEGKPVTDCAMGTWDKRDPSYRRPLDRRQSQQAGAACAE